MKNSLNIFRDYRLVEVFIVGVISAIPMTILASTLIGWLTEAKVDISIITVFAMAKVPSSLRFIWAPFIDYIKLPFLNQFGLRKSWFLFCGMGFIVLIFAMSRINPNTSLILLFILSLSLGFLSATYDINFDAYRVEKFDADTQALGGAAAAFGYKVGGLFTAAGGLYLAYVTNNWGKTFLILDGIMAILLFIIFTLREEKIEREHFQTYSFETIKKMVIVPFKDFLSKDKALIILLAIILFKFGEAMLAMVTLPFYLEFGFTKQSLAKAIQTSGFIATIIGAYCGGLIMMTLGNMRGLILSGLIQCITNLAFIWVYTQEPTTSVLNIIICSENFTSSLGNAALGGYLGSICNKKYSAAQYALLISASGLIANTIAMYSGTLVAYLSWNKFFILTTILALPALLLLTYLHRYNKAKALRLNV